MYCNTQTIIKTDVVWQIDKRRRIENVKLSNNIICQFECMFIIHTLWINLYRFLHCPSRISGERFRSRNSISWRCFERCSSVQSRTTVILRMWSKHSSSEGNFKVVARQLGEGAKQALGQRQHESVYCRQGSGATLRTHFERDIAARQAEAQSVESQCEKSMAVVRMLAQYRVWRWIFETFSRCARKVGRYSRKG
jgi:hypothetical protein